MSQFPTWTNPSMPTPILSRTLAGCVNGRLVLQLALDLSRPEERYLLKSIQDGNHRLHRQRPSAKCYVRSVPNALGGIHEEKGPRPNKSRRVVWSTKDLALRLWNCYGMYVPSVVLQALTLQWSKPTNCYRIFKTLRIESMKKLDRKLGS